jgi:hypothetical protein
MDRFQMIDLYDRDQRIQVEYPDMRREATPHVVRHIDTAGTGGGVVIFSRLEAANADELIREQVSYFEGLGQDFEWKVYDYDRPLDLKDRLAAHGFIIEEAEAIMVLDLQHAPQVLLQPALHDVRRIVDREELAHVLTVKQKVWQDDYSWLEHYLGETITTQPDLMSVYVAYIDGQPASAGWTYFPRHSQFASLWVVHCPAGRSPARSHPPTGELPDGGCQPNEPAHPGEVWI